MIHWLSKLVYELVFVFHIFISLYFYKMIYRKEVDVYGTRYS